MTGAERPQIAFFRPDDERSRRAMETVRAHGAHPVSDPMLEPDPTGRTPRTDAEFLVITSRTGAHLVATAELSGFEGAVCAIGETTAAALREVGITVDVIPAEHTSAGLVAALRDDVAGERVEIARSDHGSATLIEGLNDAGAYVHETVLYTLRRPEAAGASTQLLLEGDLDAVLFTSALTVEHFLETAQERGAADAVRSGLEDLVVGAIGPPTRSHAETLGIDVDVVASRADFGTLVREVCDQL